MCETYPGPRCKSHADSRVRAAANRLVKAREAATARNANDAAVFAHGVALAEHDQAASAYQEAVNPEARLAKKALGRAVAALDDEKVTADDLSTLQRFAMETSANYATQTAANKNVANDRQAAGYAETMAATAYLEQTMAQGWMAEATSLLSQSSRRLRA